MTEEFAEVSPQEIMEFNNQADILAEQSAAYKHIARSIECIQNLSLIPGYEFKSEQVILILETTLTTVFRVMNPVYVEVAPKPEDNTIPIPEKPVKTEEEIFAEAAKITGGKDAG